MKVTKTQKPKHGIYVFYEGNFYTPAEWGNKPADGVLLYTKYASIVIDAKDLEDGKKMIWDEAIFAVEKAGKALPEDHESIEILNNIDEINAVLRQIGGQEILGWYWTRKEYSATYAWIYGSIGGIYGGTKDVSNDVRAVTAF